MSARTNRWLVAAAIVVLVVGAMLSRMIEPGVRVEKLFEAGVGHFVPVEIEGTDGHGMSRDFGGEQVRPVDAEGLLEVRDF